MVFYFTSEEGYSIYMGKDKFENESLIQYGWPEDVWFHVDDLSSAHVYLRQNKGEKLDDISAELLNDCCQLVKANSIKGCKMSSVDIVYTRWRNLKKTADMVVGQIGFKDETRVRKVKCERCQPVVNRLNRTKEERFPDLSAEQQERASEARREQKAKYREIKKKEAEEKQKWEEESQARSYDLMMDETKMESNASMKASVDQTAAVEYEDDFM
mmetsp:Transcript_12804/g.18898  ORF Transcript_12804/g.18898 Transcript_12804/m.18898 type:complete len:214 (-) Transcript_12804:240-881(-)|eukprot:CAMPEP_0113936888 /NCGR_PEP_ID=MMETSP1339-20121228/3642_1 /TAXON_ID=94617 /ORGANISM="Fibrocapsa japonica" /LENGTH=213 /DNA_ID=CAMNT_0000939457 /DNA_START=86 /DNA_END=727 /DNA_ORIENTATION=- /assembly_acc=CAM_ASM_000762